MADFDYELAPERIAQAPVEPRDAARLLVDLGPGRPPEHAHVRDLPSRLRPGDLVVVNDSRVIPARLRLQRATGGHAEVLLLEALDATLGTWEALVRPSARLRDGERLLAIAPDNAELVEVGPRRGGGTREVRLLGGDDALGVLDRYGTVPLPPYITALLTDAERYQTVYATTPGSVAAPTAGLHLTPALLETLDQRGIGLERVELVVGLDTFKPVIVDDPARHAMHSERYHVPAATLARCEATRRAGGRVVAIGTTTVRALESAAATGALVGRTDLFIRRPYPWALVDVLLTNFHLPRTTLLLMIDAFVGERWRELYATALTSDYRFLSFGDAMLLERTEPGAVHQ
jgi:S-adenosylmethionine:tRNA ribosyltransferase-isomerase